MFITVLFVITPMRKSLTSSSNSKWINKLWFFHIMGYYQAIKRIDYLYTQQTIWVNFRLIILSQRSQMKDPTNGITPFK